MKTRIPTAAVGRALQAVATFGLAAPTTAIEATLSGTISSPSFFAENSDAFGGDRKSVV